MSRRSAPSLPVLGAVVVFGLFARLFTQYWLAVVAGTAAALLARLAWAHTRQRKPGATTSKPASLRPLLAVDPSAFGDPAKTRNTAIQVFTSWMQQLPMAPRAPAALVRSVELHARYAGRMVTILRLRKVEWKQARHGHRAPVTASSLQPDRIDPWSYSSQALREASLHIVECSPCMGQGNVTCPSCRGSTTVNCTGCGGARKAYGIASNGSRRLMNCKQCGAKGQLPCTVCTTTGRTSCSTCKGTGRAERWLEFVETSRTLMHLEFDPEDLRAFPWASDGPRASPTAMEEDARLLGEPSARGPLAREQVAGLLPEDWLQKHWSRLETPPGPGERIESQSLRVLQIPRVHVSYALEGEPPTELRLEGRRMLAPPSADTRLEARADRMSLVRRTLIMLTVGGLFAYLVRGFYFWNSTVAALGLSLAGAAFCCDRVLRQRLSGQPTNRQWAALAAAATLLTVILAGSAEPDLRSVEHHIAQGRLDDARSELLALGEPDAPDYASTWTHFHLASILQKKGIDGTVRETLLIPVGSGERASAEQHLYALTQKAVLAHLERQDRGAAKAVLDQVAPVTRQATASALFSDLKARVHDADHEACATEVCRWAAALAAQKATSTPEREKRLMQDRASLMARLTAPSRSGEATSAWLERLDGFLELVQAVGDNSGDRELELQAQTAAAWAKIERRKIPLVGAERTVATRLLGLPAGATADAVTKATPAVALYCAMKGERCAGVYLVGKEKSHRMLNDLPHVSDTAEMLSLALGQPSTIPAAPKPSRGKSVTESSWMAGSVKVVARWKDTDLIELRIGDVKP